VSVSASVAGASTNSLRVDDLSQHARIKPARFAITSSAAMTDLHWSTWAARASAHGTLLVNSCSPTCATGKEDRYRATLQLRGSRYDDGHRYYALYRVLVREGGVPNSVARAFGHWVTAYVPSDFS
jgi:hypothetical protein